MANVDSDSEKSASTRWSDLSLDDDRQRLAESIDESSILVWYASKKGLSDIEPKTIAAITEAKAKFRSNTLEAKDESQFWDNYRALAKLIAPVTVESIKASYSLDSEAKSSATKVIKIYSKSTLFVLFVLVMLQAYWFVGTSMKADIENTRKDQRQFEANLLAFDAESATLTNEHSENQKEIARAENELIKRKNDNQSASEQETNKEEPTTYQNKERTTRDQNEERLQYNINTLKERNLFLQEQVIKREQNASSLRNDINKTKHRITGNFLILDTWDFYSEALLDVTILSFEEESASKGTAKDALKLYKEKHLQNQLEANGGKSNPENGAARKAEQTTSNDGGESSPTADDEHNLSAEVGGEMPPKEPLMLEDLPLEISLLSQEVSLLTTSSVLALFNQYLLPLLYGLLGSLAYILRTLTREIQDVTYTRNSKVRYRLRWPLGVLAGVTIGWFFNPDALEFAGTITPLGLAFLAGYSVELLFVGLDRIISAFTGSQDGARHPSGM